jgi:HlyD family secretion protein
VYSRTYWEIHQLDSLPGKLPQAAKDREAETLRAVKDAEAALEQARVAYDQAQQNEVTTVQAREAELVTAQAELARVQHGSLPEDLADARAEVQRTQAALMQLQGESRSGELGALAAGIAAAQADLDRLNADPAASAVLRAEAGVTRATLAVQQAELALERATLTAPFAATIVRMGMRVGESAGQNAVIAVADLRQLLVSADVDELDVAQLQAGQTVQVSLDALPTVVLTGTVATTAPAAARSANGSNTYRVEVALTNPPAGVRPGMTAALRVITAGKDDALLVPRRALVEENGTTYVRVPSTTATPIAGEPAYERRLVTIGLSNGEFSEILSGLVVGQQVYIQESTATGN